LRSKYLGTRNESSGIKPQIATVKIWLKDAEGMDTTTSRVKAAVTLLTRVNDTSSSSSMR
jgi:hypothetical protein